jgi:hypothetical protein
MITGEEVLEVLGKYGVDFVGELQPYDRKQIEEALDYEIDMASSASDDLDAALEAFADSLLDRLKARIADTLATARIKDELSKEQVERLETALLSDVVDVVRDEQSLAQRR